MDETISNTTMFTLPSRHLLYGDPNELSYEMGDTAYLATYEQYDFQGSLRYCGRVYRLYTPEYPAPSDHATFALVPPSTSTRQETFLVEDIGYVVDVDGVDVDIHNLQVPAIKASNKIKMLFCHDAKILMEAKIAMERAFNLDPYRLPSGSDLVNAATIVLATKPTYCKAYARCSSEYATDFSVSIAGQGWGGGELLSFDFQDINSHEGRFLGLDFDFQDQHVLG